MAKSEQAAELSLEERMALLVDRQSTWRQNEAFEARLRRHASIRQSSRRGTLCGQRTGHIAFAHAGWPTKRTRSRDGLPTPTRLRAIAVAFYRARARPPHCSVTWL